jgi:hypothetical protein
MSFASITSALAYWSAADRAPLAAAVVPPCDALGDEIYDAFLAVIFRDLAHADSVIARVNRITVAIEVNGPQIAHLRAMNREHQPEAHEAAERIAAMLAVLEAWKARILDDAGAAVEGRAA